LMARTTDLRPTNKSPSKKKPPRQASPSPVGAAEPPPPKARRNLGLEQGSAEPAMDLIGALDKVIKAGSARLTTAAESPKGAAAEVEAAPADTPAAETIAAVQGAGGKAGTEVDEVSIECAHCGLELTSDAKLKKHLQNEHGLEQMTEQELADMAFAPCPVPGCNTIHSLKGATVGVTPFYRHLQQYSNKAELDGHQEHIKHMHSSDGGTSGELYRISVGVGPRRFR